MNLQNFSFENNTKFIYKLEAKDKFQSNLDNLLRDIDQGKKSADFSTDFAGKAIDAIESGDKIENITNKSREILTGLNKNQLIDGLAKESEIFAENADPKKAEEFFRKYLQQNSRENLSDDEWKQVMGSLSAEIGEVYLAASQEYQKNKFSPEMVNKSLKGVFKNGQALEKIIYQKGLRSPDEIWKFIQENPANLPDEIREAFEIENPELENFILKGAVADLAQKFENRKEKLEKKENEVKDLIANFSNKVIGTKNWENLNSDELNALWIEEFKEVDFNGFVGYAAKELISKLRKNLKEPLNKAKGEIFKAQLKGKEEKANTAIDSVLNKNSAKKLTRKELDKEFEQKLKDLELFDNLPEKSDFRKELYEKIKTNWENKAEAFLTNEKAEDKEEAPDKISREKMKESWDNWKTYLKDGNIDFKNAADYQAQFIKKYFPHNKKDAEAYFAKHKNYAKSFEKTFHQYEKGQNAFFAEKINSVASKLSDSRVSSALKASFKKARNNAEKRGWLEYLNSHVGEYEKSIQNSAKIENRLNTGFANLENHPKTEKLREKFSNLQKNRQFLNKAGQYVSPRHYEQDLKKIAENFSAIEKKDKADRQKAERDIANLSAKNFSLAGETLTKENLAKKSGIQMPEYLWKEFGQEQFWNKLDSVYAEYLDAKEGSLEKSPSVKLAKEVISNLNEQDLDFSRDFSDQKSFNRQRHLRNTVSFSNEVWEQVKPDFQKKAESLYAKHQKIRGEMKTLSRGISELKAGDLDFSKDYKSLAEFSHQPAFFEFFKNQKVSNLAYDQLKNVEFTPKVLELYGEYLKQKDGVDNSPETEKSREIIDNLKISDLDISQDFTSFTEFKQQPYFREKISFTDEIWKKVQPNFEQKALQLYGEHLQIREDQQKFEKALSTLTAEDLETDYENFSEFVHQPAMREFFKELDISDMVYDALTDNFAGKMNELWESVKGVDDSAEFSDEDIQKLGTKHGLDFFNFPLENRENLGMKFERLDKLLTRNKSLANFFRKQEEFILPVFLGVLGEMTSEDMTRLEGALGTSEKTSGEIVDIFFNSPRQKYLLSEVRKNDSAAWKRLEMAERNFDGDLDIRGILSSGGRSEDIDDKFAEFELDEDGNPIIEADEDESEEDLDSDESISEEDESGEIADENLDESFDKTQDELSEEDSEEEEDNTEELESRENLDEDIDEEEDEELDSTEKIAESDETSDLVDEENNPLTPLSGGIENEQVEDEQLDEISRDLEDGHAEKGEKKIDADADEDAQALEEVTENVSEEDLEVAEDSAKSVENTEIKDEEIEEIDADDDSYDLENRETDGEEKAEIEDDIQKVETAGKEKVEIEAKEEQEKKEAEEEEKINVEETEAKSREKILENIQREKLNESEEQLEERLEKEQKELLRLLREDEFFKKQETDGAENLLPAEDGDENSLSGKVKDDLLQRKSPINFAEIHCSGVITLGALLGKIHTYLELLAEKDIDFQINLSEREQSRETEKSREIFLEIVEFLMRKEVYALQKVAFRPQNFTGKSGALRMSARYFSDAVSRRFEISLLERS